MFLYTKQAIALAKDSDIENLAKEIMMSNNVYDIALQLAEKIINDRPQKKVVVSQEEMDIITSVFRIRGFAEDGSVIKRGRKRLDTPKDNYEED